MSCSLLRSPLTSTVSLSSPSSLVRALSKRHHSGSSTSLSLRRRVKRELKIYKDLSKFTLSSLVVSTTAASFLAADLKLNGGGGHSFDFFTLGVTCLGTGLCSASANTFNQLIEVQRDKKMRRTQARPLPSKRCSYEKALAFGLLSGSTGVLSLYSLTNPVVAAIGAANILLYAGPYTLSKPRHEVNTWIGALVGALPPLMGWAAVSGGDVLVPDAMALSGLLFLWQFPHFFSLAWVHRADYARGGFQMVPVNDPTGERTARLITRYSAYLAALPPAVTAMGLTSSMFAVEGTAANMYLMYLAKKFSDERTDKNARGVFLCSLWYLPLLLSAFVFHSRRLSEEEAVDAENQSMLDQMRNKLKGVCAHEVLVNKSEKDHGSLCPKVIGDVAAKTEVSIEQHLVETNKEEKCDETKQ